MAASVSIVIPAYNRAAVIGAAIESVLSQAHPGVGGTGETIIVDDGSTDDLAGALRCFKEKVRLIRHDRNQGAAAARNTGIAAASGTYVAFLDSDDVWLPGKLTAQINFMEAHGYSASCTAYLLKYPDSSSFVSPRFATGKLGLADLVWGCFVSPGSTLACRREVFGEIGALDETLRRLEDWDWLMRYTMGRPLGFLAQPLARVEVAPGGDPAKVVDALDRLEKKHVGALPPRERRHFKAALHVERVAAYHRSGCRRGAAAGLARSFCLAPVGNQALAAVLHNRLRRWRARF